VGALIVDCLFSQVKAQSRLSYIEVAVASAKGTTKYVCVTRTHAAKKDSVSRHPRERGIMKGLTV
jgi:hypothetical protein